MNGIPGSFGRVVICPALVALGVLVGSWRCPGAETPPWQRPYSDSDATGENVIALWHFDSGAEGRDSSGHGHDLTLRGQSRYVPGGRFGGCLESFPAGAERDRPEGAMAKNHPALSPQGAFTLEMWFKLKPEIEDHSVAFLLDKKYYHYAKDLPQANWDYCLYLRKAGAGRRQFVAFLGYGTDSCEFVSHRVELEPGQWYHVAFTYDGAGTGRFFLNGKPSGRSVHPGRGSIAPGKYGLVIGCRYGSIHQGFPGYIDEVRISKGIVPFFSGSIEIELAGRRRAFVRMEPDARIPVGILNDTGKPLDGGTVRATLAGAERTLRLSAMAPGASALIEVPVDTRLRPDRYALRITASATSGGKTYRVEAESPVWIVPRRLPHRMPVVMWGTGDLETVKAIGFTHQIVSLVDYRKIWEARKPTEAVEPGRAAELAELLDQYLVEGIGAVASIYPGRWVMRDPKRRAKYGRINRQGKPYGRENVCCLFPEVRSFAYNTGASVVRTFGRFPALESALVHTEVRDSTNLCFHEHDRQAYRDFSGSDIPEEAVSKHGVNYSKIDGFPAKRIIPDDDPILAFYRWFWKEGDGWNPLHTLVHKGLKSTERKDLWTFFDPAVRVPSVWGSGGGVDVISQWTYSYPDPIKIGQAADELFAMAAGAAHGQQVMKMTQIIWYRSQTAPKLPEDPAARAPWENEISDARFITIAPDHLREAFWSKISRPVQGIMYHGWGSLVRAPHGAYRFTHPETRTVLTELIHNVIEPLGPTLVQVPDRKTDVALLESFAAQMFAGRGTYGWSHRWEADMHLVLQWAGLQPRIVYDETVLRDGLDDFRVLVVPNGDVLTEGVASAITAFQRRGGILVADEHLAPGLKANVVVPSYRRTGEADKDKAALVAKATELRRQLGSRYRRYADSSNADVVVRLRRYGDADYVFTVNDRRTFGRYVGHHGRVMEKGLPAAARISLCRKPAHVYDLVLHRSVAGTTSGGGIAFEVKLGPGDGRVFLVTEQKIAGVAMAGPDEARRGNSFELSVSVVDERGEAIDAVVPLRVEILDPESRRGEFSGHYGAKDGRLAITVDLAPNDLPGTWTVRATELASGQASERRILVKP